MPKYRICDWEDNGYHDSYFYVALWDTESKKIENVEYAATAYAGGRSVTEWPRLCDQSEEIRDEFKRWLIEIVSSVRRERYEQDRLEPQSVKLGEELIVTRPVMKRTAKPVLEGEIGRVFWQGAFGRFYRNGYNRPCRSNTRVGLELTNGDKVFVPLSACRRNLDERPVSKFAEEVFTELNNGGLSVKGLTLCRAWLTAEYWR